MSKYNHKANDSKWGKRWLKSRIYTPEIDKSKDKFYNLWMFPYPSAEGLHAGHAFSSTGSDVFGRFMRMNGHDVFEPIGYDSFGIHSENFAIKTKKDPHELISKTTKNYARQMMSLGHGYDWSRTITTSEADYYKWTQWLFIQMFKAGLAYREAAEVNWCPSCKTVLADEQVMTPKAAGKLPKEFKSHDEVPDGVLVCERCGTIVVRKNLEQWFFRITKYADRLLNNLKGLDWPEKIKLAQTNWIGKKEGINISYKVEGRDLSIVCWTSRPETNFGATFVVLSPQNPVVEKVTMDENKAKVSKYIEGAKSKSPDVRTVENREKTGVFTGSYAINNLNGERMPIWVSDFVLGTVGTGAVVGVPGHDIRDFEFAKKFKIPTKRVIAAGDGDKSEITKIEQIQEAEGEVINSDFLNGMDVNTAKDKIMDHLEKKGVGKRATTYHLRDWLISRQRYWGPPIPMIYCEHCAREGRSWFNTNAAKKHQSKIGNLKLVIGNSMRDMAGWYPVSETDLPVKLPKIKDYLPKGTGRGPLADHPEFYKVSCPGCGKEARRETDVSDTFLDSSWYFLRYPSVNVNSKHEARSTKNFGFRISDFELPWDSKITRKWLPVDLYFGGAEHAVLHLMYARFVTMVLHDLKLVEFDEPFPRFFAHGLMIKDGAKMSKSRGNVVNPDIYITKYGADTLRLYLMFMGPMDGFPDFRDTGIEGMRRFVERIWDLYTGDKNVVLKGEEDNYQIMVKMHQTIKKVTKDIESFKYNTAISAIMDFVNALREKVNKDGSQKIEDRKEVGRKKSEVRPSPRTQLDDALETLVKLLAPFTPFISEEIWVEILGKKQSVHISDWPKFDPRLVREKEVAIAIQVDGKLRGTLLVSQKVGEDKNKASDLAKSDEKIAKWLKGRSVSQVVFVPGKVVNFVTVNI